MSLQKNLKRTDIVGERMTERALKKTLFPAYKKSLDEIRKKIAVLYEKYSVDGKLAMADVAKYNRLKNLETDIAKEIGRLTGGQVRTTSKTIKDVYQESYYRVGFSIEDEANAALRFGKLPEKQVEAAVINPMDRIGWQDRTKEQAKVATRQIKEEITRGIIQGRPYPDVARDVTKRMNMAAGRAERIVRTEGHRAREMGKLSSFQHAHDEGVRFTYIWQSALDANTRELHEEMDGREADEVVDGRPYFSLPDGVTAEGPGMTGEPHHDINCRCSMRAEVKDYSPDVRRRPRSGEEYDEAIRKEQIEAERMGRDPRPVAKTTIDDYKSYTEYAQDKDLPLNYSGPEPRV